MVFLKEFFEKVDFEKKNQQTPKNHEKFAIDVKKSCCPYKLPIEWMAETDLCFVLTSFQLVFHLSSLCMLGNFSCFCCRLLTFFSKLTFSKKSFRNTIRMSISSDQDQLSVGPDLGPNCLQRLSADDIN